MKLLLCALFLVATLPGFGQWIGPVQDRDRFFRAIHDAFTAVGLGQMDAPTALLQAEQQINQMIDEVAGP